MDTVILTCARCGGPIRLTNTTSLWRPDGEPYGVYHHDCYQEAHRDSQQ